MRPVNRRKRPATPGNSTTTPKITKKWELPAFIRERLDQMRKDILLQMSSAIHSSVVLSPAKKKFLLKLDKMTQYYFKDGKMLRPMVALLIAAGCNQKMGNGENITENQYKLAMVCEMFHVAGLIHDDVIDEDDKRRGKLSLNAVWGNKIAVLVGDFVFSKAMTILATIGRPDITLLVNKIIEDTVESLVGSLADQLDFRLEQDQKNAGSMFEFLCRGIVALSGEDENLQEKSAIYGRYFGLSYKLLDDALDVEADMKRGVYSVPLILAAQKSVRIEELMKRNFEKEGDFGEGIKLLTEFEGFEKTKDLAKDFVEKAVENVRSIEFENLEIEAVLVGLVTSLLDRSI